MTTETPAPEVTEVKAKRGRPAGSKNGPKASSDLTLAFDGQKLTASTGAEFVNGIWTFDGYNAADAADEMEAAQHAVERLKAVITALKGLPVIDRENYAASLKGQTAINQNTLLRYFVSGK